MTGPATPTETVDLSELSRTRGGSNPLQAFVARPKGPGPHPVVVLIHEIFGLDVNARQHAERLAGLGYLVVAPDLFSQGAARRCLVSTMRALSAGQGRAFVDIETARRWARSQPDAGKRTGIIGFCMGGGFALLSGSAERFDAASVNYGRLPAADVAHYEQNCPVVGSYGAKDRSLPNGAEQLREKLTTAGVENEVTEYPNFGHGFLNESLPGPTWLGPLFRVAGLRGDEVDRGAAWQRIEAFFAEHLRE